MKQNIYQTNMDEDFDENDDDLEVVINSIPYSYVFT